MDLKKLWHAVTLSRIGHFGRAATELCMTQSALTRSVQSLEADVGMLLFDRDRAGVRPTPAARNFLERAEEIVLAARQLKFDLTMASNGQVGEVAFGMAPLPASIFLAGLLEYSVRDNPGVRLKAEINGTEILLDQLIRQTVEFFVCVRNQMPPVRNIKIIPLIALKVSFYTRREHPLASVAGVTIGDVARYPLVTAVIGQHRLGRFKSSVALPSGDSVPVTVMCNDFSILRTVTLNSDVVWLTCQALAQDEPDTAGLTEIEASELTFPLAELVIVMGKDRLSPAAGLLVRQLHAVAQASVSGQRSGPGFAGARSPSPPSSS